MASVNKINTNIFNSEPALLIDPETSAKSNYNRVARDVCHELAHMWFGNLVTME